jgi:hypothetical protein
MNSPRKFAHLGVDALRSEVATPEAHRRIRLAIMHEAAVRRRGRMVKVSLATVVVFAVVVAFLLAPRASLASTVTRILRAIESARRYHLRSYESFAGQERLVSETWLDGAHRRFVMYGPDGKPMPNSDAIGGMTARLDKKLRGMTPAQLMDPRLREKLTKDMSDAMPGGFVTMVVTVDGKQVTDLPDDMKAAIKEGRAFIPANEYLTAGGEPDVAALCGLLKDPALWVVARDQRLNGRKVDRYTLKGGQKGVTLFVDAATYLPVSLRMTMTVFDHTTTTRDDFDYPSAGP